MRLQFIFLILSVFLLNGCTDNLNYKDIFEVGLDEVVIQFSFEQEGFSRSEDSSEMESFIDHAYLLFYSVGADVEKAFPVAVVRAQMSPSNPCALSFSMPLRLIPDTDYCLLAIANADCYVPEGYDSFEEYVQAWVSNHSESKDWLKLFHPGRILASNVDCLPMQGRVADASHFRYSVINGECKIESSLSFRRLVARIDVVNKVDEGFLVEGVALCNWRDAVSATASEISVDNILGSIQGNLYEYDDSSNEDIFLNMPAKDETGYQKLQNAIYCFPSISLESSSSDQESTALIIKARFQDDEKSTYYRINVASTEGKSEIKPNTKYTVSIQSVSGRGAASVKEAYLAEESPIEVAIPEDMPFALVPLSDTGVNVNHVEKTIEIDGFDPDCFNSFIDVPFKVYINPNESGVSSVNISSSLLWPLEGRVSTDTSHQYTYCVESFAAQGSGQVCDASGSKKTYAAIWKNSMTVANDNEIYISVGAMGPDDPAIIRTITLSYAGNTVTYTLIIKPRKAIIDDVILRDETGNYWLVQDRNIQDFNSTFKNYIGLDSNGKKGQAYNYTYLMVKVGNEYQSICIPNKFSDIDKTIKEDFHLMYLGKFYPFRNATYLQSTSDETVSRLSWLKKYSSEVIGNSSPFYMSGENEYNYTKWIFPSQTFMEVLRKKLRVTKMRMYLCSEFYAKENKNDLPVCCYLPYSCVVLGEKSQSTYGYFTAEDGVSPKSITVLYFDHTGGKMYHHTYQNYYGLSRLVRPLTAEELGYYKEDYLGYGSKPLKLTICNPDTYESTSQGWIPY